VPFRAFLCPQCGGPLPPNARRAVVTCPYCRASVAYEGHVVKAADYRQALRELDLTGASTTGVTVAGVSYRILGRLGRGECCDVFLAERSRRLTERTVIKVLRSSDDVDMLDREKEVLQALHGADVQGSDHFSTRVPEVVRGGRMQSPEGERSALVLRHASGFTHTLADVRKSYPDGIDPRHAAWMWRRMLETLGWVHRAGFAHGALVPRHFLVHARDHGIRVVGWSCATRLDSGEPLPAMIENADIDYPEGVRESRRMTRETDIAMSARSIRYVLAGADGSLPRKVPAPLADLVRAYAGPDGSCSEDAWEVSNEVAAAARAAFGPPAFVPLHLPGWRSP
jgi:Lipopolysaccharide kinase (Kdo/WaaP) family